MTHLDLCTGIGGFHLAAEWAGFDTIGFSEIEPYCSKLLAQKYPDIPNYGDLRTADFSGVRNRVDVLSGGIPCQPHSLAGKRRGKNDDRELWPAARRVIEFVQPKWVIIENTPGLISSGAGQDDEDCFAESGVGMLESICHDLESIGFAVRPFLVPASALGAGHLRYRVFIVSKRRRECRELGEASSEESGEGNQWKWSGDAVSDSGQTSSHALGTGLEEWESFLDHLRTQFPSTERTSDKQRCMRGLWFAEPPLCRRTDGIPNRSHRLKALGNAVVPQQVYTFFQAIKEAGGYLG